MTIKDIKINDIGKKLLFSFLFIVPIFWAAQIDLGHTSLRFVQEQAFQLGAIVLYAVILLENIYLAGFLILTVTLYIAHYMCGSEYLINIFYGCLIYQISYKVINSSNIEQLFKVILWLAVLNIIYITFQNIGVDFIFFDFSRPGFVMNNVGFMGLKCFMGMLFAFALPFALYFNTWIALLFLLPIGLSESSIAIIAAACVLIVHFWWILNERSKLAFVIALIVLAIGAGVYTANDSKANMMSDRFNVWKLTLKDACKKPLIGWGLDSFRNISANGEKDFNYFKNQKNEAFHGVYVPETGKFVFPKKQITEKAIINPWDNPHNEYVMIFFEFGIFSLVILWLLFRDIVLRFVVFDSKQKTLILFFLSFAVCSTAQFPAHVARLGLFLPVMLGAYYKLTDEYLKGDLSYGPSSN